MEERKWKDLDMDCLVNIIGRVGMESLILDVPFVCKSWYKATLSPLCWQKLHFPPIKAHAMTSLDSPTRLENECHIIDESSANAFITSVVKRSDRSATSIVLPPSCTEKTLLFIADEGFDGGDDEIIKLASHITTFKDEGSFKFDFFNLEDFSGMVPSFEPLSMFNVIDSDADM
ncbi:hypothetical protein Vadar_002786 [Vaccinium darrowii]|uniref:Uncharacterized protein n=1 Tax=Vaccinium darrowii TaxID=229202 RepID=A0ACB7XNG8_9ERIC|nr:hypothetical protein Vadar_002786 [Vaccinium darrowii]